MSVTNEFITPLDIRTLLEGADKYVIPIYQRNYSWEAKEIEQLIQDIIDYSVYHNDKRYYIGTLVVAPNHKSDLWFDTIDGQQRLTTLSILSSVINNEYKILDWFNGLNIRFASRKKSMDSLEAVFKGEFLNEEYEANIKTAYDICNRELGKKIDEYNITLDDFIEYFYKYVTIIRVVLPEGIDLNHYFEIMNSRGEQLEKHEILKAQLMSCFENSEKRELYEYCFDLIWETCSNMEKYVQYGFTPAQRHLLFGKDDWNELVIYSFDDFIAKISSTFESGLNVPAYQRNSNSITIEEIINLPTIELQNKSNEDQPDRFNSVINFPNFLLHVLRVQVDDDKVALDDKRLINIFEEFLPKDPILSEEFIKQYIFNLLKCKFLFDKYIIKREFTANTDRWALKCLKWYSSGSTKNGVKYVNTFGDEQSESFDNENRRTLMLLSMFHVSIPSMSYKYWLNAALRYVFNQTEVETIKYISYLEHIAKSFVFDNYLGLKEIKYDQMIRVNLNPIKRSIDEIDKNKLSYLNVKNNLVFNFCDYLLWLDRKDIDQRIKQFEFTFRSSIEHYYPQNPINNAIPKIDKTHLHSFGNLCLISHEKNSRLNNHTPQAKQDYYRSAKNIDSIKQYIMMQHASWGIIEIENHEKEIVEILDTNLNSNFSWEINATSKARKWYKLYKSQDKILLIRALMCFGEIDFSIGWTLGMEKYNYYQWDRIEKTDAYLKFETYIIENNPSSLQDIIKDQLVNCEELRENSYLYAFVSRPSILRYCKEGNFGWADNGKRVVLLENSRASIYQSCDLYSFCLKKHLKTKFEISSYCGNDRLKISLEENDGRLTIAPLNWNAIAFLEVWNNLKGNLCYELNTRDLHGNSKIIRNLKESGWDYNDKNRLFFSLKSSLIKLSDDVEGNIVKAEKAIESIIKKL